MRRIFLRDKNCTITMISVYSIFTIRYFDTYSYIFNLEINIWFLSFMLKGMNINFQSITYHNKTIINCYSMLFDFIMPKGYFRMNVGTRNNLKLSISKVKLFVYFPVHIYYELFHSTYWIDVWFSIRIFLKPSSFINFIDLNDKNVLRFQFSDLWR